MCGSIDLHLDSAQVTVLHICGSVCLSAICLQLSEGQAVTVTTPRASENAEWH